MHAAILCAGEHRQHRHTNTGHCAGAQGQVRNRRACGWQQHRPICRADPRIPAVFGCHQVGAASRLAEIGITSHQCHFWQSTRNVSKMFQKMLTLYQVSWFDWHCRLGSLRMLLVLPFKGCLQSKIKRIPAKDAWETEGTMMNLLEPTCISSSSTILPIDNIAHHSVSAWNHNVMHDTAVHWHTCSQTKSVSPFQGYLDVCWMQLVQAVGRRLLPLPLCCQPEAA